MEKSRLEKSRLEKSRLEKSELENYQIGNWKTSVWNGGSRPPYIPDRLASAVIVAEIRLTHSHLVR